MASNNITPTSSTNTQITNPDVKLAFDMLKSKKPLYDELYRYYEGFHPLKYSTNKLRDAFDSIRVYFAQNWLGVIVDAALERIILKGFDISNDTKANDQIDKLWQEYNIAIIAEDVHEAAGIVGEGFVIAMLSNDIEDEQKYDIYYNDPRMCHVFYESDQPNEKRFAAKVWIDPDGYYCLALYYSDHFEYYKSNTISKQTFRTNTGARIIQINYSSLRPDPDLPYEENPFDPIIPVFHFITSTTTKKRDLGPSEISMQDAINKLVADMMVSSEFATFTQRVIISQEDPGNMPNKANANWWLPAGDGQGQGTSVQELGGRVLSPFLDAIDKIATSLAIISRTPKHYFFEVNGNPSGEALIAQEAPLNKKVKKRIGRYSVEWKNLAYFLLLLSGTDVDKSQIQVLWEPVETLQPQTSAQVVKTQTDSGVPLITALRWQGKSSSEIQQMEDDKAEEKKQMGGLAQSALDEIRAQDAQNNIGSNGQPMQNNQMQNMNMQNNNQNMMQGNGRNNAQNSSGNAS